MAKLICALAAVIVLSPHVALAGGDAWLFKVQSLSEERGGASTIVLIPDVPGSKFPICCTPFTIVANRPGLIWRLFGSAPTTPEDHARALKRLVDARNSGESILIGAVINEYAEPPKSEPCVFRARALSVDPGSPGQQPIVIFHRLLRLANP